VKPVLLFGLQMALPLPQPLNLVTILKE
jgi:hypothetical protein